QNLAVKGNDRCVQPVFSQERREVFARWRFTEGDSFDRYLYFTMHNGFDVTDFRQEKLKAFVNLHPLRVLNSLLSVLAFESGIGCPTLIEVHKSTGQVQTNIMQDLAMGFTEPVNAMFEFTHSIVQGKMPQAFTCLLVSFLTFVEAIVPQPPRTTERLSQFFNLLCVWIYAYFGGCNHVFIVNNYHCKIKSTLTSPT
ncbi:MAG: hypothetical protein Q7U18_01425, partial [Methylobacter sp.]|nr:hypothetical protein [Methylobacter sp.]